MGQPSVPVLQPARDRKLTLKAPDGKWLRDRSPDSVIDRSPDSSRMPAARKCWGFALGVAGVRVFCGVVFIAPFLAPAASDAFVAALYRRIYGLRVVHLCMFEAGLSTFGFFQAIALYQCLDALGPVTRRFRVDGAAPVPYGKSSDSARGGLEAGLYLLGVALYHVGKAKAPLDPAAPTSRRLLGEVCAGIFLYDFLFYWIHRAFHAERAPTWLRRLHRTHHHPIGDLGGTALRARETTHHSLFDGFCQVACNVAVQQVAVPFLVPTRKHDLSRFLHNLVVTYMLVEIHSGYDAPWSMHNVCPFLFGGARSHELHHKHGTVCYGEFFRYMDVLLGCDASAAPAPRTKAKAP